MHATRKIAIDPPIYEFNGPIGGTYPPSYDPSYWNEGRHSTWNLHAQLSVIVHNVPPMVDLFMVNQPCLMAGFLFLLLWSSDGFLFGLVRHWDLLTISFAVVGLYMLVYFDTRYVGAFVVLIWFSAFLSLRVPGDRKTERIAGLSIVGLVAAMLLSFTSYTAKKISHGCPESAEDQLEVSRGLSLPEGTPIAVIGYGNYSYWAHFAHLRIVADVMSQDEPAFWKLTEEKRQEFYTAFRVTGAKWIVGHPPSALTSLLDPHWKQIGATEYYRYLLNP